MNEFYFSIHLLPVFMSGEFFSNIIREWNLENHHLIDSANKLKLYLFEIVISTIPVPHIVI